MSLSRRSWPALLALTVLVAACASDRDPQGGTPRAAPAIAASTTATAAPSPTPAVRLDIRATRLVIPALRIDSTVQLSQVVPDTSPPTPGCPAPPEGQETLSLPQQGIATPEVELEGMENKAWIFGHSRWLGQPGLFLSLQDLNRGDEVFIDGVERHTGASISHLRFVVDALYLTDLDSGTTLVEAKQPAEIPDRPTVLLQTSVREEGPNRPWILDRQTVTAKSRTLIEGDINDPCKYLLLFVVARAS
jgi:hypothetical protein